MYICIYVCNVCMYIYIYVCVYIYIYVYMYVYISIYMIYVYVCIYICKCLYIYIFAYVYISIYVYVQKMYLYVYIYYIFPMRCPIVILMQKDWVSLDRVWHSHAHTPRYICIYLHTPFTPLHASTWLYVCTGAHGYMCPSMHPLLHSIHAYPK